MKEFCKEAIRRKGLEKVTVEELVAEITPKGRGNVQCYNSIYFKYIFPFYSATIPEEIKTELLQKIRKFLQAT